LLAPTLFAAYYLTFDQIFMGQRNFLLCPLLMFAAHLVAERVEKGNGNHLFWLAGGLLGAAITIKPFPIVFVLMLAGIYLYGARSRLNKALADVLCPLSGVMIMPALMVAWLWNEGALPAFVGILTQFLPVYSRIGTVAYRPLLQNVWGQRRRSGSAWCWCR
jgi:hypothetical protein